MIPIRPGAEPNPDIPVRGEITIPVHEIRDRISEIPYDREDCFLVDVQELLTTGEFAGKFRSIYKKEDPVYPIPFMAFHVDVIKAALEDDDGEWWEESFSWDKEAGHRGFRLGCNTPGVMHPLYLVFRWGEVMDILPCAEPIEGDKLPDGWPLASGYCRYCYRKITGHVFDCSAHRLSAIMKAVEAEDMDKVRALVSVARKLKPGLL